MGDLLFFVFYIRVFIGLLLQTFRIDQIKQLLKLNTEDEDTSKAVSWFNDNYEIDKNRT
jgi:hypothetical protein